MNKEERQVRERFIQTILIVASILVSFTIRGNNIIFSNPNNSAIFILLIICILIYNSMLILRIDEIKYGKWVLIFFAFMSSGFFSALLAIIIGLTMSSAFYAMLYYFLLIFAFSTILTDPESLTRFRKTVKKIVKKFIKSQRRKM
jgi:hypothetical protein